jgi:hypothetical protein
MLSSAPQKKQCQYSQRPLLRSVYRESVSVRDANFSAQEIVTTS